MLSNSTEVSLNPISDWNTLHGEAFVNSKLSRRFLPPSIEAHEYKRGSLHQVLRL